MKKSKQQDISFCACDDAFYICFKGRGRIFYVFDRGKFHMAARRGYDWDKEKIRVFFML
jgi:hypothetical protein